MKIRIGIIFVLFLLLNQWAVAQQPGKLDYKDNPVFPQGIQGERIRAFIDVFNTADIHRWRQFIQETVSPKLLNSLSMNEILNIILTWQRTAGKAEFHSIRTFDQPRQDVVVIVKTQNFDAWQAFVFIFDPANNFLIDDIDMVPARVPSDVTPDNSKLTEKEFLQKVETFVKKTEKLDLFSGTLLIAKGDKVLFSFVCGEADKGHHVKNNIDTKFNLGSMNKMFTATAIAQLVEKGKLSFLDTIDKYVDESWLPKEITAKIMVHHLLTHHSGLGSYFNQAFMNTSREKMRDLTDFKSLVKDEKLQFEPGTRFAYSNTGFLILGVIIEKVSGQSYFDYIRQHIYEPAGMKNSDSYELDFPIENLATGYSPEPLSPYKWRNNIFKHVIKGGPAGGGYSTVKDLFLFSRALLAGKLVSKETLKTMWTNHNGDRYGYGYRVAPTPVGLEYGHSGGFSGLNSKLSMFPEIDYTVAIQANYDSAASMLGDTINTLLFRLTK